MSTDNHRELLAKLFSFIGGLSGLLSIALIIWKGGVLWQMVVEHDRRIVSIENGGSMGLREHVKLDDERVGAMQRGITEQREAQNKLLSQVGDLATDVKVINAKLDSIKEQISNKK